MLASTLITPSNKELSPRAQQDHAWVQDALAGNAKAYENLLARYRCSLYLVVLKIVHNQADAQDVTSEAFARAFRHLPRYRPDFAFSTWLFRIATNRSIDFVRRHSLPTIYLEANLPLTPQKNLLDAPDGELNPQDALIRQQRCELVQQVVARLPPPCALLIRLRYFEELSYEEVATKLKIPLGTMKARLFYARKRLLHLLENSEAAL